MHLQELADYSAVVEAGENIEFFQNFGGCDFFALDCAASLKALRSLAPVAVGVEEADMAVIAGRNLRARASKF